MKVFLVERVCYDDFDGVFFEPVGIFSTLQKAEEAIVESPLPVLLNAIISTLTLDEAYHEGIGVCSHQHREVTVR